MNREQAIEQAKQICEANGFAVVPKSLANEFELLLMANALTLKKFNNADALNKILNLLNELNKYKNW
jgi:hypothetical protein